MIYCLLLIYSLFFTMQYPGKWASLQKGSIVIYMLCFLSFVMPWIIVCGGQYETGTDYNTYMSLFRSGDVALYLTKREYLFAYIVELWHELRLCPQGLYFFFYTVCFCFLGLICHKINNRYLYLFIILYFTVSSIFFNQLNLLRQSTAAYIVTYGAISYLKDKSVLLFFISIFIGSLFHASSWIVLIVPLVAKVRLSLTSLRFISIICLMLVLFGRSIIGSILDSLVNYIPSIYRGYLASTFNTDVSLLKLIPKLCFFPLYFFSLQFLGKKISFNQRSLFIVGMFAYLFRLVSLTNVILDRLGYIFILISIFPLFLYWQYLSKTRRRALLISNIMICISVFLIKTLFLASNEYDYHSIYIEMIMV